MRAALLTAGGYPYRRDALSAWCRLLVDSLPEVTFELCALTDGPPTAPPPLRLPPHVAGVTALPLTAATGPRDPQRVADATVAAALLCRGLADGGDPIMVADALRRLAAPADDPDPLAGVPLAALLGDAWRISGAARREGPLTAADAAAAGKLLRHAGRALAVRLPAAHLLHCVGGTAPLLAALADRWRTLTPIVITEARPSGHRPGEQALNVGVRTVLRVFRRAVTCVAYAEAALVVPAGAEHRERVLGHGVDPARVVTVPVAGDPRRLLPGPDLVERPSLVWSGTRPGAELRTVLDAYGDVLAAVPGTMLHLLAPQPWHQPLRGHAEAAGLTAGVRVEPPPADHRRAYARAQVTVHVPSPADPPHRLVQAMFAAAPIVAADVGDAADTLGDAGIVVPAHDPAALAAACTALLRDPARRHALGAAARRRALAHHTPDRLARAYRAIYDDVAGTPARHDLDLAIPAPRSPVPATARWFQEDA